MDTVVAAAERTDRLEAPFRDAAPVWGTLGASADAVALACAAVPIGVGLMLTAMASRVRGWSL